MKTIRNHDLSSLISLARSSSMVLAALLPASALADFSGSDSLARQSKKWAAFTDLGESGGGKFSFRNSRLEFLVPSPTYDDLSVLRWTRNQGGYGQDWFIQVDVHLDKVALASGSHTNLNLGVINTDNSEQAYMVAIDRYKDGASYVSGFETNMLNGPNGDHQKSSAPDATLRIHFDSIEKTMTGSWKSGSVWKYFPSAKITGWKMEKSGTFTAVLAASGGGDDDGKGTGPVIQSGEAFFSNFKTGAAVPDIAIEQPAGSDLSGSKAKKSFGAVSIDSNGRSKTFTIRNTGTANLVGLKIAKGGTDAADFTITGPTKTFIKPGASATFRVSFKPKTTGTKSAVINIISNDPDESRFDIELTGQGVN